MAYAIRGSIGTVTTGTTSTHPAFSAATAAGNLLVAWVVKEGANTVTCNDGTWARAVTIGVSNTTAEIWYKPNSGATETSPTFSSTSASAMSAAFAEFTGGATSSPVDQTATGTVTTATSNPITAAQADQRSGELVLTCEYWFLSMAATKTTSDSMNNGATATGNLNNDATSIVTHYRMAYGITTGNSSADSNTAGTTSASSQTNGAAVLASFLLPPLPPTPDQPHVVGQAVARAANWMKAHQPFERRPSGILVPSPGILVPRLTVQAR